MTIEATLKSSTARLFVAGALALICASAAAADSLAGRTAVVWSPGGEYTTALKIYVDAFESATGAKITLIESGFDEALAAARAQVKAGKLEWDGLSSIDAPFMPPLVADGVLQKIDVSDIDGVDKLPADAVHPYGVAVLNSSVTASFKQADGVTPLNSVKDFFNPEIKGPRGAGGAPSQGALMCTLALASDGVSVEEMTKSFDLERCFAVWDRIRDQVTAWWMNGSQMAQIQIDEEVDYCLCWDGRIIQAALANPKWHITYDHGIQFFTYFVYLKGTKNADVMNEFVQYMLDPKLQAQFTQIVGYSAPNPEAIAYLPEKLKPFLSVTPEAQKGLITVPDALNAALETRNKEIGEAWAAYVAK